MKKQTKYFLSFFLPLIIHINTSFPQGPGEPFHPMTANGANGISWFDHNLYWENPGFTEYNKIYFSDDYALVNNLDSSVIFIDGYPDRIFSTVNVNLMGEIKTFHWYYWRVVEYNNTGYSAGPVWFFRTRFYPAGDEILLDDFEDTTLTNFYWTITNEGGTCIWQQFFPPYPNNYILPSSAGGGLLSADSDSCGSGTTLLSSAIYGPINSIYFITNILEFDQDFNAISSSDEAWVEVSTDDGITWSTAWSQIGVDLRGTHEEVDISSIVALTTYWIKFRSVQPGWDWWWVIDNVSLVLDDILTPPIPPNFLSAFGNNDPKLKVNLQWTPAGGLNVEGYQIERKNGLPLDTIKYVFIAETDAQTLSFIDTTVNKNSTYTYRVRAIHGVGEFGYWSNEATAYVPDIPTYINITTYVPTEFYLEQNYPNPFNPTTKIKFSIPSSTLRQAPSDVFITLKVYDVLGNEIATLVNEEKPAGTYEAEFNTAQISNLGSGIYFYQLSARPSTGSRGHFIETKKMIFIK